jgi:hypothetical protein
VSFPGLGNLGPGSASARTSPRWLRVLRSREEGLLGFGLARPIAGACRPELVRPRTEHAFQRGNGLRHPGLVALGDLELSEIGQCVAKAGDHAPLNADNVGKLEITASESLLFGRNFGLVTDIHTGPDGHLYVVSNTHGAVYEIFRRR